MEKTKSKVSVEETKSKVSVEETKTKSRGKEGLHSVFNSVLSGDTKSVLFISNPPIIIPRVHFMNSCLTVNDTFSCAVDCFLEISHSVLHPELERFRPTELSPFFQCLVQTCGRYTEVLNGVRSLTELPHIQEFIWCQIRDNCPSFSSKSCDAQFSEIFSAAFFSDLRLYYIILYYITLYLCKEARVMLTRNLWTEKGLCNGSMGYVKDIIYKHGDYPPSLRIGVLVQFDETYIGPSFHKVLPRYVPVLPVTSCCNLITTCERMQMPLKLAWSITIHKSQGLTLSKAWVDLGKRECFAGLTYVAISRVRKLEDLLVEPMSLDRLNAVKHCPSFTYRQIEEKRLQSLAPCKNMAVSENKLKL